MIKKQVKFYKEWLKATNKKHSVDNLNLFIRLNETTLKNLSRFYK